MPAVLALALVGTVACGGSAADLGMEEADPLLKGITEAHNNARFTVNPTPSTAIPPLAWSATVAATAQSWAANCQFMHSSNSSCQ